MPHGSVIYELAQELGKVLKSRKLFCAVAESCTGGSLAGTMTAIPGSSEWFDRGFVTYSNKAKEQMLNVPHRLLRLHGAVSEEVVCAMAHGALAVSDASVSVAITGIAGPGGGSDEKPIGMVWIAWAGDFQPTYSHCYHFEGNRPAIRHQAVYTALEGLIKRCDLKGNADNHKKTKARYFFALFPDEPVAEALAKASKKQLQSDDCTPIIKANLHLTLLYLGSVPPDFLQEAMQAAGRVKASGFTLNLNEVNAWPKNRVRWLGMTSASAGLQALVAKLNTSLLPIGFKPEQKPFIPHVTIAKNSKATKKAEAITSIPWNVKEFHLVKSIPTREGSHYEKIASWPLKK